MRDDRHLRSPFEIALAGHAQMLGVPFDFHEEARITSVRHGAGGHVGAIGLGGETVVGPHNGLDALGVDFIADKEAEVTL